MATSSGRCASTRTDATTNPNSKGWREYGHLSTAACPRVLVVDDNATSRTLAQATLEDDRYDVILAEDGMAAIAAFERVRPQCILLDLDIPGMDWISVSRWIRELPGGSDAAIVFVTARQDVETFDRAVAAGGDDFMTKPYRPSELAIRIRTALKLRRVAHERDELYELIEFQRDDLQRIQHQIRDANEKLVIATVQADELADQANAARAAATETEERLRTHVLTSSALVAWILGRAAPIPT